MRYMRCSLILVISLIFSLPTQCKKEQVKVRMLDQKESDGEYAVSYPGYQQSNCGVYVYGNQGQVNCTTVSAPGGQIGYTVRGYALTLLLPDKRIVIAGCEKKTNWTEFSANWYRSCRHPITNELDAEFEGDHVKLSWSVSLDGRKMKSETYKIAGVLSPIQTEKQGGSEKK
jgi:hypothetical protein